MQICCHLLKMIFACDVTMCTIGIFLTLNSLTISPQPALLAVNPLPLPLPLSLLLPSVVAASVLNRLVVIWPH